MSDVGGNVDGLTRLQRFYNYMTVLDFKNWPTLLSHTELHWEITLKYTTCTEVHIDPPEKSFGPKDPKDIRNCRGEPKVQLVLIFDSNITLTTYIYIIS